MKKELIKRIKNHNGEVKQDWENDNKVVVEFVPKYTAVECGNVEQFNFTKKTIGYKSNSPFGGWDGNPCVRLKGDGITAKNAISDDAVMSFTQYISYNDLKDEYLTFMVNEADRIGLVEGVRYLSPRIKAERVINFPLYLSGGDDSEYRICCKNGEVLYSGKWATIIEPKLEMVKGEVYCANNSDGDRWLFRFESIKSDKREINYYSLIDHGSGFRLPDWMSIVDRTVKPSTNKQKAKLIKAEIKNGWLWDGKELIELR